MGSVEQRQIGCQNAGRSEVRAIFLWNVRNSVGREYLTTGGEAEKCVEILN